MANKKQSPSVETVFSDFLLLALSDQVKFFESARERLEQTSAQLLDEVSDRQESLEQLKNTLKK